MVNFRAAKDPQKNSKRSFLQQIRHLGKIYDFDMDEQFDYLGFQQFLDLYDSNNIEPFNISSRLKMVGVYSIFFFLPQYRTKRIQFYWRIDCEAGRLKGQRHGVGMVPYLKITTPVPSHSSARTVSISFAFMVIHRTGIHSLCLFSLFMCFWFIFPSFRPNAKI